MLEIKFIKFVHWYIQPGFDHRPSLQRSKCLVEFISIFLLEGGPNPGCTAMPGTIYIYTCNKILM